MRHVTYGQVVQLGDHAMVSTDGALSLQRVGGAAFTTRTGSPGPVFVALELTGEVVASRAGAIEGTGDTVTGVWLASLPQVGELVGAVLRATAGLGGMAAVDDIFEEVTRQLKADEAAQGGDEPHQ